jgi:hypothetical protein
MAKIIRPTYPVNFSIGLLLLIFVLSSFLSFEIFDVRWRQVTEGEGPLFGMMLAGIAVVITALILWEEFLFPVRIKPVADEIVFRNHFTKLKTQILIWCLVPIIAVFIYSYYEISYVPFFIWAGVCIVAPVAGKLLSGIKNYNDFLKLTNETLEYKNNDNEGVFPVRDIQKIGLIRDADNVLHKIEVVTAGGTSIIDLDEMELESYLETIHEFVKSHYGSLVK